LGFSGVYRYGPQVSGTNAEIEGKKRKMPLEYSVQKCPRTAL